MNQTSPASSTSLQIGRVAQLSFDARQHERIPLRIPARLMFPDGEEVVVETIDISASGIFFRSKLNPSIGQKVVVYLQLVGGLEGQVVRTRRDGFAVEYFATPKKRAKIIEQITCLLERELTMTKNGRRHERIRPTHREYRIRTWTDEVDVELADVSQSGAAFSSQVLPLIGDIITVGTTEGKVVRHFERGFAIEFLKAIPRGQFGLDLKL